MGSELREQIDFEVQRLGLPALRGEEASLEHELWAIERRIGELRRAITVWDRWMIFSDTTEETQLRATRRRYNQVRRSLAYVHGQIAAAHASLAKTCPPFAVALRLSECLPLAYTGIDVAGRLKKRVDGAPDLQRALAEIIEILRTTYFPKLDFAALRSRLADEAGCQQVAGLAELPLPRSPEQGYAPFAGDVPVGHIAARLLSNGYFAMRRSEDSAGQACMKLQEQLSQAERDVGWWARINIITKSPEEHVRDHVASELAQAQDDLRANVVGQYERQHDAMRAYPPLDFYHGVVEALGITSLLRPGKEAVLASDGTAMQRSVVHQRSLLLAALRRLQRVFTATFPGVPLPEELRREAAHAMPSLDEYPGAAGFLQVARKAPRLAQLRDEALGHATMFGQCLREREVLRQQISVVDRLVFWSDTAAETAERELVGRCEAHENWNQQAWRTLMHEARTVGASVGPLALRDGVLAVQVAIAAIHTDPGSSSFPKNCRVYKREAAEVALRWLRDALRRIYGVAGSPTDVLNAVLAAAPEPLCVVPDPVHGVRPLTPQQLASMVAYELRDTNFQALAKRLSECLQRRHGTANELQAISREVSLWDRINVFTTTAAEAEKNRLDQSLSGLQREISELTERIFNQLVHAMRSYPPGQLGLRLDVVERSVANIRAVCRSYTVTTRTGNTTTTSTRYRCELVGKPAATATAKWWAERLVHDFGEQLNYHELLEAFELMPQSDERERLETSKTPGGWDDA